MAHETAVHRVDAELAAGSPRPIAPDLAADGIDEFLQFFLPEDPEVLRDPGESVHLHATDSADEWLVTVGAGAIAFERRHAKADVAARAPVSDLLLALWRRVPVADLDVVGDAAALERFLARPSLT
jgi:predicted lipid carrier protein YhbT